MLKGIATGSVDTAGAVMEADFNANSILAATSDDTPVVVTVGEQTLVGRITSGVIKALSIAEVLTLIGVEAGATADQSNAQIKTAYEANSDTNEFSDAEQTKLSGIEASADVTDATNVNAAGAVMEADFNANTVLAATSDDTPVTVTVGEQTLLGRITSGNITALTATQIRTLLSVESGADATDATNVNAAGAVMEADFNAHTILQATSDDTPVATTIGEQTVVGRITSGNIKALSVAEIRTLINVENGADVTDATNVNSSGAVMESDCSAFVLTILNDASARAVRTTLISGVKGADVASTAGVMTLGADGDYFDITGTNSITGIATLGIGQEVTLHFDAAATLVHHSTDLIMPGAANVVCAAGDEFTFIEYASADWRCTSYALASGSAIVGGVGVKGTDVASTAGVMTLGDGTYFDITGTNSITGIATLGIGKEVTLHFDAAAVLVHDATNFVLPGGANITCAANDEFTFVEYASADWRCVSYVLATGLAIGGGNSTTDGLYEHSFTIAGAYTIGTGNNALSAGPITIGSSGSVTVPATSTWVIA